MDTPKRQILLTLPNLAEMPEEGLKRHFYDRDGKWSDTTKAALARHKVTKLDLDANWAATPHYWECPGCGRTKPDIFKVSPAGVLLANLHLHHDHLQDRLKASLEAELGPEWSAIVTTPTGRVHDFARGMIARFEPTLVCVECNNVDNRIKSECPEISPDFSFSPKDIRQIVTPSPGRDHDIDFSKARALYSAVSTVLAAREALLNQIARMMIDGNLNQDRAPNLTGDHISPERHVIRGLRDGGGYSEVEEDLAIFTQRSLSRQAVGSRKVKKNNGAVVAPSPEELATYDGGDETGALWRAALDDWHCPACSRTKGQILRRSNNHARKWSGKLVRHTEYILGERLEEETGIAHSYIDHQLTMLICSDCANLSAQTKQRNAELSNGNLLFQLADMKRVAIPAPNVRHNVDYNLAETLLKESANLRGLVRDYEEECVAANGCRLAYEDCYKASGKNQPIAKQQLISDYMACYSVDCHVAEARIRQLLKRANYILKADSGRYLNAILTSRPMRLKGMTG